MNYTEAKAYLMAKPEVVEDFPGDGETGVYKVKHKMFATLTEDEYEGRINLKCDPDEALVLRETYDAVIPGHKMNKRHWNTVILDGSVPEDQITKMIDTSYAIVVRGMRPVDREELEASYSDEELYGDV